MRGRTNIAQRSGIVVHGDVITATAEENIGIGSFVEYETITQQNELFNYFGSISELRKAGDYVTFLYGGALVLAKNINGALTILDVYNNSTIKGIVPTETNIFVFVEEEPYVLVFDITGDRLTPVEIEIEDFNPTMKASGGVKSVDIICCLGNDGTVYFQSWHQISSLFYRQFYQLRLDGNRLVTIKKIIEDRLDDGWDSINTFNNFVCNEEGRLFATRTLKSTAQSSYTYIYIVELLVNEDSVDVVSLQNVDNGITSFCGFEVFGNYIVYTYDRMQQLYILNADSKTVISFAFFSNGLTDISSPGTGSYGCRFAKISHNRIAIVLSYSLSNKPTYYTSILEFKENTKMFDLISHFVFNLLNYDYSHVSAWVVVSGGNCFLLLPNSRRCDSYSLQYDESSGELSAQEDKTYVKNYQGGRVIGFAKFSAKTGDEIQIYTPSQS